MDNKATPVSPISFTKLCSEGGHKNEKETKLIERPIFVRDELALKTSDNNDTPESLMMLSIKCKEMKKKQGHINSGPAPSSIPEIVVLFLSAFDNSNTPESPILPPQGKSTRIVL